MRSKRTIQGITQACVDLGTSEALTKELEFALWQVFGCGPPHGNEDEVTAALADAARTLAQGVSQLGGELAEDDGTLADELFADDGTMFSDSLEGAETLTSMVWEEAKRLGPGPNDKTVIKIFGRRIPKTNPPWGKEHGSSSDVTCLEGAS